MANIQCHFFERTGMLQRTLRRFSRSGQCSGRHGLSCHDAKALLDEIEEPDTPLVIGDRWPHDDPRWPDACACGYRFDPEDHWQLFLDPILLCGATGVRVAFRDLPIGAMYYRWGSFWAGHWTGPDGKVLAVVTPGGTWDIDSRASNCTDPADNEHRCWVRHGEPPHITVDKSGRTCGAGAGSIALGTYHGFLRNGILEEC